MGSRGWASCVCGGACGGVTCFGVSGRLVRAEVGITSMATGTLAPEEGSLADPTRAAAMLGMLWWLPPRDIGEGPRFIGEGPRTNGTERPGQRPSPYSWLAARRAEPWSASMTGPRLGTRLVCGACSMTGPRLGARLVCGACCSWAKSFAPGTPGIG